MEDIRTTIRTRCLEKEAPFCSSACPFHLDVREFVSRIGRGSFNSACRLFSNAVGFPAAVALLCSGPCEAVCPRKETDGSIALNLLERSVLAHTSSLLPPHYNMPPKKGRFAVVGAGLSGLGCALRLANRKYGVTLFEREGSWGGALRNHPEKNVLFEDFERQFMHEEYDLRLNSPVDSLEDLLGEFDGVYVATGKGGDLFGLLNAPDSLPAATSLPGVFLGGEAAGATPMEALAQGLQAATLLEGWLKTGNMKSAPLIPPTQMQLDPSALFPAAAVLPAEGGIYSAEEAKAEANRCVQCRCDACIRHCGFLSYFEKFPKRIDEEVEVSITPVTLDGNGTVATRLISTCNQCGLCKEVCPVDIDVGEYLRGSHRIMREKGAMPWAWHEFWLRDMAFSNGERAALLLPPPGERCDFLFYPGCQLGASDPRYVLESYRALRKTDPQTALLLGCCGAPAVWGGDVPLHEEVCRNIRTAWKKLGSPPVILACPSCLQMFGEFLPEISTLFLSDHLLSRGVTPKLEEEERTVSVFDPCSARYRPKTQKNIRSLVEMAGCRIEPLPYEGARAQCCSWGGQISIANPPFADWLAKKRAEEGEYPYVTYCANCRDVFAETGKPVKHILDILFGLGGWNRKTPGANERRRNREHLKKILSAKYLPGEPIIKEEPMEERKELTIPEEVREKMDRDRLLEEDALAVIEECEATGQKVIDSASGHIFGSGQVGQMTQWVEYELTPKGFLLHKTYSHRMKIEK